MPEQVVFLCWIQQKIDGHRTAAPCWRNPSRRIARVVQYPPCRWQGHSPTPQGVMDSDFLRSVAEIAEAF